MDTALAILIGLGLAAACGFRVFVPLAVMAVAHRAGFVGLADSLAWLASTPAIVALATATVLEIVAYKVPWLDHALDTIATPAAIVAGAVVAASQIGTMVPAGPGGQMLTWSSGIIAGGVAAGAVQAATVSTRAASTVTTAGLANPIIAVGESAAAVGTSVLVVVAPAAGAVLMVLVLLVLARIVLRLRRAWAPAPAAN